MAKLAVPPPLQDKLGDEASAALIDLLHETQNGQRDLLLQSVEDRFLRHVAESESRLRSEMQAGFLELQRQMDALRADVSKEIAALRKDFTGEITALRKDFAGEIAALRKDFAGEITDVRKEIGDVRKEIGDVRKEITDVRKEIGDVRKEITTQTRWLLTVMVGAAVLIPVLQRVMAWLLP